MRKINLSRLIAPSLLSKSLAMVAKSTALIKKATSALLT